MQIVVLCNDGQKAELLQGSVAATAELIWVSELNETSRYKTADALIDLLFYNDPERINTLNGLGLQLVMINSVTHTLGETDKGFVRVGAWNTFLKGEIMEACCLDEHKKAGAEEVWAQLGKKITWLPDAPGMATPRVISMIINEAYLALEAGVSTPSEIDTAMKLGTAYPHGPFEWGNLIGLKNVVSLLKKLAVTQPRYAPAALLVQESDKSI